jgi:1,4-alpha-glucan branching enzyme
MLTDQDVHLFHEGRELRLYDKLGAHLDAGGARFAVWAPGAEYASVVGDFNDWDRGATPMRRRGAGGIWEAEVPGLGRGSRYKYHLSGPRAAPLPDKADPLAFRTETPPGTASVVWDTYYEWHDDEWMAGRGARNALAAPWSIYEVHLGSWAPHGCGYVELGDRLADHAQRCGFTHVELLPVMEHPFHGSWGYQVTGYFAPTSRYGTPQELMTLIERLHQRGIGVVLDWVPAHFPGDEHGLARFDGTPIYEHPDPRRGFHPDWNTSIFDYGRPEVRSFLLSSALFWLDRYHADGLRVDGVASMLYLDYSRRPGEWVPNPYGGNEYLEAVDMLRQLNVAVYERFPDVQTIAEESTAWPMVSRPVDMGGLGFGMKWDMGWMHDTLEYMAHEPVHRRFHHGELTFRAVYAFTENFVLPLSHDEVVYGKGSLLGKMPGDEWQRFANLRLLYGYMFGSPGKKLLFMGGELAQEGEWNHDTPLDWGRATEPLRAGVGRWVADLNRLYRSESALHRHDFDAAGFEWVDGGDAAQSVLTFLRRDGDRTVLVACNFTPVVREGHRVGVPRLGRWAEVLNGDGELYGGSGVGNLGGVDAEPVPWHGRDASVVVTLPPLAAVFFRVE